MCHILHLGPLSWAGVPSYNFTNNCSGEEHGRGRNETQGGRKGIGAVRKEGAGGQGRACGCWGLFLVSLLALEGIARTARWLSYETVAQRLREGGKMLEKDFIMEDREEATSKPWYLKPLSPNLLFFYRNWQTKEDTDQKIKTKNSAAPFNCKEWEEFHLHFTRKPLLLNSRAFIYLTCGQCLSRDKEVTSWMPSWRWTGNIKKFTEKQN